MLSFFNYRKNFKAKVAIQFSLHLSIKNAIFTISTSFQYSHAINSIYHAIRDFFSIKLQSMLNFFSLQKLRLKLTI